MGPCVWILPASSPAKHVSLVDVPTMLKTAVAHSSVLPVPETQMDRWKRQRNVHGVLGVHVDGLVGGGNLAFQKSKVDFDFVVESCVKNTIENPSRSPCRSLFKKWSPLLFPNM